MGSPKKKQLGTLSPESRFYCDRLRETFPATWLEEQMRATGVLKRLRKFNPILFFWLLVLDMGVALQKTLEGLRRKYNEHADEAIGHAAFYAKFRPELVKFLHVCVVRAIEYLPRYGVRNLSERLAGFKDLVIQDSTVIRLHGKLSKVWPITRGKTVAAGVKLSVLVSCVSDGPKRVQLFGERTSEVKTLRLGPWIKDRILLVDLGFFKYNTFDRIQDLGGYFVSRLKENANPFIVSLHKPVRGNSVDVERQLLRDILPRLERKELDVTAEVLFKRRTYGGKQSGATQQFRIVAVHNEKTGKYHCYVTNLPDDKFTAGEVAHLYRARWEIEILFRELKETYRIDKIPMKQKHVVEAILWTCILTFITHRILYLTVLHFAPPGFEKQLSHEQSAKRFRDQTATITLNAILFVHDIPINVLDMVRVASLPVFNRGRARGVHMEGIYA